VAFFFLFEKNHSCTYRVRSKLLQVLEQHVEAPQYLTDVPIDLHCSVRVGRSAQPAGYHCQYQDRWYVARTLS